MNKTQPTGMSMVILFAAYVLGLAGWAWDYQQHLARRDTDRGARAAGAGQALSVGQSVNARCSLAGRRCSWKFRSLPLVGMPMLDEVLEPSKRTWSHSAHQWPEYRLKNPSKHAAFDL